MPLTVRTNGSGGSNIIQAAWWNDYYNLLTGAMTDQEVSITNLLILKAISAAPGSAPTLALASGTALGVGVYKYAVTFANADGETLLGPTASITTTTNNQAVSLTAIPTGPTGTTKRYVYRTTVGGSTFYRDNTLNDNTTTGYTDTTTDATLTSGGGTLSPVSPSFGGSLIIRDVSNNIKAQIYNDGTIFSAATVAFHPTSHGTQVNGSVGGNFTYYFPIWDAGLKVMVITLNNYNSASNQTINFPTDTSGGLSAQLLWWFIGNSGTTQTYQFMLNGTVVNADIVTALGTGSAAGSSTGGTATIHGNSMGQMKNATNQFQINQTGGVSLQGVVVAFGT